MGSGNARRFARVASVLAAVVSLSAQQNTSSDSEAEFAALLAAARQSLEAREWERSTTGYEALVTAARAKGIPLWEGRGILGLGQIANEAARYADARRHGLEALAVFERLNASNDIGDANKTVAIAAQSVNDGRTAKTHYERAVTAYRAAGNERARVEASFLSVSVSPDNATTLDQFAALQVDAQALGEKDLEGRILHSWGDSLFNLSVYQTAIEKLEAAAAIFQETDSRRDLSTTYNSLGRVYRAHGQPAAALEFQLKALEIVQHLDVPRLLIQSLNAVAVVSQILGNTTQARVYYERALAEAERTGTATFINFVKANLGWLLIESDEDVDRGRDLLERAIAAAADYTLSGRYAQLSHAYRKLGRYQDALEAAGRALKTCDNPTACIDARTVDGLAQLALGNEAAALADQKEILAAVEKMHTALATSDFLKQNFQQLWEKAYSLTIDLHFRRGEFREALEAAEMARSRAFLDLLASRELQRSTRPNSPVPAGNAAKDSPQPVAAPGLILRGAASEAGPQTLSTTNTLRSDASAPPPTLEDLTAIAARLDSTLLAYWVGANNVYVWALSPDGRVRGASVSITRTKLDQLIRSSAAFTRAAEPPSSTRPALVTRGDMQIAMSPRSRQTWRALYDLLIAPIERELPRASGARLTIVPYGPLLSVPFAALRDARGRYLVERYTIHSVPAGAVLQFTAGKVRPHARAGSVLLIGDPARPPRISGDSPLPRLAGASEEVRAIARLLPASRTTVLAGEAATEPRVRAALPGKAVIHFATHGIARDGNPLASFLALGTVGNDPGDGQLTADKIYGLDLDASLIVLSACRSGGGVVTGDGIAGLARAFFYAGTPSVMVSVWDVADQPTHALLPAFYRHWLNGADKAKALRAAQLSLIRNLRAGQVKVTLPVGTFVLPEDPAFWAAFVLLGEPD